MGLQRTARLPIFGLGCAGGVLGLARAASQAAVAPGKTVLFLVVELCALSFRRAADEVADGRQLARLLRARGERPRGRCASEQRHELASLQ